MYIFRLPSRVRVQQNTLGRPLLVKHGPSCLKFIRVSCFRYSKPLFSTNRNEGESATPPGTEEKDETYIKKLQDVANQFSFRSFEQQQPEADSNLPPIFPTRAQKRRQQAQATLFYPPELRLKAEEVMHLLSIPYQNPNWTQNDIREFIRRNPKIKTDVETLTNIVKYHSGWYLAKYNNSKGKYQTFALYDKSELEENPNVELVNESDQPRFTVSDLDFNQEYRKNEAPKTTTT